MSAAARRRGWCPGALRPMLTGDGLLVRVRITGGVLAAATARAMAQAALTHGNGLIDLSARANLQLRGVSEASLPALQARLDELGLLDADAGAEQVRNVMASPLAGLDPAAVDVSGLVVELEQALAAARDLHDLPAKFFFAVDGAGMLPLDVEADVGINALGADRFRISAAGRAVAEIGREEAIPTALALARDFLARRKADERRMSAFAARMALGQITPRPAVQPIALRAGFRAFDAASGCLAAGAPFGRFTATQLAGLADLAESLGAGLRLTPWRAILLAPIRVADESVAARGIAGLGLVTDAGDPLLRIAACPGKPACLSGEAEVQADARRLAGILDALPPGASLHVSGCPKGCARREPATISLTADSGRYALAFHARADDARQTGPLTVEEVEDLLASGALAAYAAPADATRPDHA